MNTEALEKELDRIIQENTYDAGQDNIPTLYPSILPALSTFIEQENRNAFEAGRKFKEEATLDFGFFPQVEFHHKDYESYTNSLK